MILKKSKVSAARGTALSLAIVVSVVMTAMVAALAWTAGVQSQMTGGMSKSDAAFYAAEAGAQRVVWYLKNNATNYHSGTSFSSVFTSAPFVTSSPYSSAVPGLTGTAGSASFVTTVQFVSTTDLRLLVKSTGTYGGSSYSMSLYMSPPSQGVATFATAGDWDNKNVDVVGDVQTKGKFTNSGSGSLRGNLFYGDATSTNTTIATGVSRYVDPTNAADPNAFHELEWDEVATTLDDAVTAEGGTATFTGNQSGKQFDFTALSTTNKVYKVVGNVTDPTFKGSGTLYVVGSVNFTKNVTLGDSSNPVNIVSMGTVNNLTFDKKATIYGSLYAQGDWNRAQTDVYGMVYVQGISKSNNGSSSLNATGITVPFFDTRAPAGSAVTSPLYVSNFSGPSP